MLDYKMTVHNRKTEPWRITLVDTGDATQTGGRLRHVAEYLPDGEDFCFTYGDGLADVDITSLLKFHRSHGRLATMTAVQPPGRFGAIKHTKGRIDEFLEKPAGDGGWINGGFFVLDRGVSDFVSGDDEPFESGALTRLAHLGLLGGFEHFGFWKPMDTLREKLEYEELFRNETFPWLNLYEI